MQTELSFGQWLQRRRRGLGLSQVELGHRVGYSGDAIRKVEADERRPSKEMAAKLAEALEIAAVERAAFIRFARDQGGEPLALPTQTATLTPRLPLSRPTNLPTPPTPLIGRERELAAVGDLLQREEVRLVTLTGAGGTGKTRLALEVAADLLDADRYKDHPACADGVFFVNLAPIRDPNLVASTIASVLDVREAGGRPLLDSLKDYLREKDLLLLLDNFEQIVSAAPVVAELLAQAPRLKVLVTSRERLHLRGEKEVAVPPLALPDIRHLPPVDQLAQYGAVALFIQRAWDAKPDFAVTHENAPAVAEICYRLDGLPLAIELAAARIKMLSPPALLARLDNRLKVLTGGARDLPPRQQTLRAAIAWSYDLLDEAEKKLFRRLAVFVGGRTLEVAEVVCSADGDLAIDILDGTQSLVDKSLLWRAEMVSGELRYMMLVTIREYALERLAESGEAEALRRQHARFFLDLAERAESELRGPQQRVWLDRLATEHDNLRAALEWSQEWGDVKTFLRLSGALWRFWYTRGYLSEGRGWLETALARSSSGGVELASARAKVLAGAGSLASAQGDYALSIELNAESLALYQTVGDTWGTAFALNNLGIQWTQQGDYARATASLEESLVLYRATGDKWGIGIVLANLGTLALDQGDYARAIVLLEESLALVQEVGDKRLIAIELHNLGDAAHFQGNYARATALLEESIALCREVGYNQFIALSLNILGRIAQYQGDYGQAVVCHAESLAVFRELADKRGITLCLEGLGAVRAAQGRAVRAARLLGAAEVLREVTKIPLPLSERMEYERHVATVRSQLDEERFAAAWAVGRAMTLAQAIEYALERETEA